jgi:hypothetical protein
MIELIDGAASIRSRRQCVPMHRREMILIPDQLVLVARFGLDSTPRGDKQAADAHAVILRPGWNFLRKCKEFI